MLLSKSILIIGYFGFKSKKLDGQTVKTNEIQKLLELNNQSTYCFDTEGLFTNPLRVLFLFKGLIQCNSIVYLPGRKNLRFLFPFIFLFSKIKRVKITYIVIGGWLDNFLNRHTYIKKMLSNIDSIHVESPNLRSILINKYGLDNVHYLPNFRIINFTPSNNSNDTGPLRIVFMSRIIMSKGIDKVFEFAKWCKENNLENNFNIDFYGTVGRKEIQYFDRQIGLYKNTNYKGVLSPNEIYTTLTNYDVLVLPTSYDGEGFPGAILDAYISGIPVIASKWRQIPEFVDVGETGYLFDLDNKDEFKQHLINLEKDRTNLSKLKVKSYNKSKEYSSTKVFKELIPFIS